MKKEIEQRAKNLRKILKTMRIDYTSLEEIEARKFIEDLYYLNIRVLRGLENDREIVCIH
jgi:hypothetical protein